MRSVISVIDLQSDLERERTRCTRKDDPDKAGLLGIVWLRIHWTADAQGARVSYAVSAAAPSLRSSPHVTAASASHHETRQSWRHRSRLARLCHTTGTSCNQQMRPADHLWARRS
jgi:hypothetical protein